ncbi:MAG: FecR family protein [bacterium]
MKNLSAVLLAFCLSALRVFGDDPVGNIENLTGSASARNAAGESRDLAKDAPVFLNDRITTGPGSKLTIRFADNTTVGQGENAELVINRYVYAPDDKGANAAAFRLVKGVFRFLTDQITKLNPEQFEVEANYGTIGIRGCELCFNLGADRDDVFIVALTGNENILFNLKDHPGGDRPTSLLIREAGIAVAMSRLEGLAQRRFEPDELRLFNFMAPQMPPAGGTGGGDTSGEAPAIHHGSAGRSQGPAGDGAEWGGSATTPLSDTGFPPAPSGVIDPAGTTPPPGNNQSQVNNVTDNTQFDQQSQDARPVLESTDGKPVSGDGSGNPPADDGNPAPTPPDGGGGSGGRVPPGSHIVSVGPSVEAASGSGLDWSWGIWASRIVYVDAAGVQHTVVRYTPKADSLKLDPADALAIATGNILYNLHGVGDAGATVVRGDRSAVLDGTATIDVNIGQGISPTWTGDFGMQDTSGNALQFQVNGIIGTGGDLQAPPGNPVNYNLNALGFQSTTPPTSSHIGGNLVGPGTGPNPINGAIVEFSFDHGPGNPIVHGVGGADLR